MSNEELVEKLLQLYSLEYVFAFSKMMIDVSRMQCERWNSDEPCEYEYDEKWWRDKHNELKNYKYSDHNSLNSL
jgi:hypothetical protein